jgi:hypothetical protein
VEVLQVKRAAVALCLTVLVLLACGPRSVQGSLSVVMDLRYTSTEVVMGTSDVTVRYFRPATKVGEEISNTDTDAGQDLVLAVSARGLRLPFAADGGLPIVIDLARDAGGSQVGALSRNVLDDPQQTFPAMERGQLRFNAIPVVGKQVDGDFAVTFVLGEQFGDGRTMFDNFQGKVR